ncbi:hypothetical protein LPB140_07805 [Sphingorhabdus lutea]|uniref:Bifunctional enzyme IspD/IspF n=1 Tax=Sphingorhabdus lutea TaxID=1913578 RepID=A0A1L3JC66_9SPHN|nr:bifunctional 2-C-methyl-D-erythritol 4-phosphate cytidylyltransferase/2-C-methyl-D-erythritol 2,4-cyclodiphosphate synthase [Sphingorhabdus lutea]APG62712.1 hypothetical protein LPB140_07805 [Sphingorhabdus lutea]
MQRNVKNIAIILAGGVGARAELGSPKQFAILDGRPILQHNIINFTAHPYIDHIILVCADINDEKLEQIIGGHKIDDIVQGGETRRKSAFEGLKAAKKLSEDIGFNIGHIFIHDAARPHIPAKVIDNLVAALKNHVAAIPILPVADTILQTHDDVYDKIIDRNALRIVQTPQAFDFDIIYNAHENWDQDFEPSDDAQMVHKLGLNVAIVDGDIRLKKYTYKDDFMMDGALKMPNIRIGGGYDVHRLISGDGVYLCGVKIDCDKALLGHSDADVALHAATDAILGAIAAGDIGDHFPPSDAKWAGASSDQFLAHAVKLCEEKGYYLSNMDITIICEYPKIGPYKLKMRQRIAEICKVEPEQISVKATTTEKLGFTGRGEGIAAMANVIMMKKEMAI